MSNDSLLYMILCRDLFRSVQCMLGCALQIEISVDVDDLCSRID